MLESTAEEILSEGTAVSQLESWRAIHAMPPPRLGISCRRDGGEAGADPQRSQENSPQA